MNHHLVIFAGGLGSRLLNTENMPKPLVNINGKSLLGRIIISFQETGIFSHFHVLTCLNGNLFNEKLSAEISENKFTIYEERARTGRAGALKNFLNKQSIVDEFFVCNGDTYFLNLKKDEIIKPLNSDKFKPIVFLAPEDATRNDYKSINFNFNNAEKKFQNSGLFYLTRKSFENLVSDDKFEDIDDYLFLKKNNSEYALLSSQILDGGTPDRLFKIRGILK